MLGMRSINMEVPALGDSLSWDTNQCVCDITTLRVGVPSSPPRDLSPGSARVHTTLVVTRTSYKASPSAAFNERRKTRATVEAFILLNFHLILWRYKLGCANKRQSGTENTTNVLQVPLTLTQSWFIARYVHQASWSHRTHTHTHTRVHSMEGWSKQDLSVALPWGSWEKFSWRLRS